MCQAVGPCPHCAIYSDTSSCSRTYDTSGLIYSYFIHHNISFNCPLHVPNCSCYQFRPCKYIYISSLEVFVIGSYVITHSFCLGSHVFSLSVVDLTLFFDWPCASLSLVTNCVVVHENSLLIARLALIVSVYRCYSCISFVAFFVLLFSLFSFLCFFVFLFFLRKSKV